MCLDLVKISEYKWYCNWYFLTPFVMVWKSNVIGSLCSSCFSFFCLRKVPVLQYFKRTCVYVVSPLQNLAKTHQSILLDPEFVFEENFILHFQFPCLLLSVQVFYFLFVQLWKLYMLLGIQLFLLSFLFWQHRVLIETSYISEGCLLIYLLSPLILFISLFSVLFLESSS